ncbi:MAG: C25 family cysteine peptidase [Candidatus Cloacimonas sp.]
MKKALILISVLLVGINLSAFDTIINIDPYAWQNKQGADAFPVTLTTGEPILPFVPVNILLPFGNKYLSSEVSISKAETVAENITFEIAMPPLPTSAPMPNLTQTLVNPKLENRLYPDKQWQFLGIQYYRGYQIALFNVYPYRYNPITKKLFASSQVQISLNSEFEDAEAEYEANFYTNSAKTQSALNSLICNPENIATYQSAPNYRNVANVARNIDLSTPRQMIIITNNSRLSWFSSYSVWHSDRGVSNAVFSVEDILSAYPGTDNAEKIRNFIINAYQTWANSSQPLEYVILGGDDEIVPERGAYGQVGDTIDLRMPTDIYFSNLDGDWNANQNQIWGETNDNTDMIPEIHIGRFPAETQTEFNNMFSKIQYYVDNDTFSNNLALFIGEQLNDNPLTWGGDYKDNVAQYLPDEYNMHTLYQRDGTYSSQSVYNAINAGAGIMNHMGHANESTLIGQSNGTVESLTNTEYGFLYSQGCYPAAFDQRTSGNNESIGEHFVTASGALFSFIGNTRYGWYSPGNVNGASEYYDRQFFNGLFEQNYPALGEALTYSRLQNLNNALSSDVMRWCYYEMVLFGDPSIEVKPFNNSLPFLNLDGYTFSDEEGDNNGTISIGELICLHPLISNANNWNTAFNVSARLENLPEGINLVGGNISIPQILPGGLSSENFKFRLQLSDNLSFGSYNLTLVIDSINPLTQQLTGERRFTVSLQITMIDNRFPWETMNNGKSAPVVANLNSTNGSEIIYADVFGNSYYIGTDGNMYQTIEAPEGMIINHSFAYGDVDGDTEKDLVFCSRSGNIFAMRLDGDIIFNYQANTMLLYSPVLADIDGNGSLETIAGGIDGNIYAVSSTGALLNGFPYNVGSNIPCELAAADINADGALEIVAGSLNGLLYVIGNGGMVLPGFPLQLNGSVTGSPTITNTNRIVCSTPTDIYIISPSGNIVAMRNINSHIAGGFALGDITADDIGLDIVGITINGFLYALNENGADLPGFPVAINDIFNCPPLLANLDNDPQAEILVQSYENSVYGYNADGSCLSGYPFMNIYNGSTPATLVDFDANNQIKMVMGHSNGVLMLNLQRTASDLRPWITYRGSSLRQGSFVSTGFVSNSDELGVPSVNALLGNYPNPFNPETTIRFSTKANTIAKLEIFNLKGQKIRTLIDGIQNEGNHSIIWNGRDDFSREVASGVYFYRLSAEGKSYQHKMLLLK